MLETSDRAGELVVHVPSFGQCIKLGAGFALGAAVVAFVSTVFWMLFSAGALAAIGFLSMSTHAAAPAPARPTLSRPAPSTSSEFEQRVQRIMKERADMKEDVDAFGEALRREQPSRQRPVK